jgi:hypothetical protein
MDMLTTLTLTLAALGSAEWRQPPIVTGIPRVEALRWEPTIESALARAKAEKKLVLATVVALSDAHWAFGYADAEALWSSGSAPAFGADVSVGNDPGLRKERVMMAAWFADPDVAALVERHFVPVRVRCRPWDFDVDVGGADPLAPLGTTLDEIGGPALVFAQPDGKCVHALGRIGVFAPGVGAIAMRAALAAAGVKDVTAPPAAAFEIPQEAVEFAAKSGIRLEQWTRGAPVEPLASARTTEIDASQRSMDAILGRAADVLLALEDGAGVWRDPAVDVRTSGGAGTQYDLEVPRTALVVDALLGMRARLPARRSELEAAARRGIACVGSFADAPKPWIWHVTYALHLQVALLRSDLEAEHGAARARAARLIEALIGMQQNGGWSYVRAPRTHSFNTALGLLLLSESRAVGVAVPDGVVEKARAFLTSLRNPDEARDYWYAPKMEFEARASTCRTALCELALQAAGDASASKRLAPAVAFFFEGEPGARSVTKIYESFLSPTSLQDAYHYYFGHYYVARALEKLPKSASAAHAARQIALLKRQVEVDGSFVDAQAQGKAYSTAMAVLTVLEDLRWTSAR